MVRMLFKQCVEVRLEQREPGLWIETMKCVKC